MPVPFSPIGLHIKQMGFSLGLVSPELQGGLWAPQTGRASQLNPTLKMRPGTGAPVSRETDVCVYGSDVLAGGGSPIFPFLLYLWPCLVGKCHWAIIQKILLFLNTQTTSGAMRAYRNCRGFPAAEGGGLGAKTEMALGPRVQKGHVPTGEAQQKRNCTHRKELSASRPAEGALRA